jgi:hypothetical protein
MKRISFAAALLVILFVSAPAFSQSSNASISGTIADATGAIIPGVSVTAKNVNTGVANTVISNDVGVYNFPSLIPGTYNITAQQPGFKTEVKTGLQLGNASRISLNFTLEVSAIEQTVEVSVAAETVLLESTGSSVEVLSENVVQEMPMVNNDSLDLVRLMSGTIVNDDPVFGRTATTISGVTAANINVQRDGVPISAVRFPTGISSPTRLNPEMVGEMRIVTALADAEMGRGVAQVQVQTRSGSNEYHGSLVWNIQNNALDSNRWLNNRDGTELQWRNLHQYSISAGGPIIKNKTFFFALWDGQIARMREPQQPTVLTPCARNGIFRYYDNWNNGAYGTATTSTGATPTIAVVDRDGNPVPPSTNPDGTPHNGILRYISPFGEVLNPDSMNADCSNAVIGGTPWDPYRTQVDPTGYIDKFISYMPLPNLYTGGDGLNTATSYWIQGRKGADNMYGVGEDNQRKEINIKIDHVLNSQHRVNASWSYARNWADNNYAVWPEGFGGHTYRYPQVLTVNFTSAISPSFLNEARFGLTRTGTNGFSGLEDPEVGDELASLLPKYGDGLPMYVSPGTGAFSFAAGVSNIIGGRGQMSWSNQDKSRRYAWADTISWTRGKHSMRFGGEYRWNKSLASQWGINFNQMMQPLVTGGDGNNALVDVTQIVPAVGILAGSDTAGNLAAVKNMMTFFAGSVGSVAQAYYINSPDDLANWNDPYSNIPLTRDYTQREFSFFFQDNWKFRPDLTLNLGLRYEVYGVPYLKNGMTVGLEGGNMAMFGVSGRSWDEAFWKPGIRAEETRVEFIGPGSQYPDRKIFENDYNNFGPAVGFAWQLPWFGKGKTTLRAGYQLSFLGARSSSSMQGGMGNAPGSTNLGTFTAEDYLDLGALESSGAVPAPTGYGPMQPVPLTDRVTAITVFSPRNTSPYVQNLQMKITRNVTSHIVVDLGYIGTLSRKGYVTQNINLNNFLTNGLLQAFNSARSGAESELLDKLFEPIRGAQTGAAYLRASARTRANLANGNYNGLSTTIDNWALTGQERGGLLRAANALYPGEFPENFIKTNPQFGAVNLQTNMGNTNYHSLNAQFTLRPVHGISATASYTWSRNLGKDGAWTNPLDYDADYILLGLSRKHNFTTYGTINLPLGPNRLFFGDSSGIVARLLEDWQLSWDTRIQSGEPVNIAAQNMLYANGTPDQVGEFDRSSGEVTWMHNAYNGYFYGIEGSDPDNPQTLRKYVKVPDPQCAWVDPSLAPFCTLDALAVVDAYDGNLNPIAGNLVFQHPLPGNRGNVGRNAIYGPGTWRVNVAMSKAFRIAEGKILQFRVDANNIFNHPEPSGNPFNSGTRYQVSRPPSVSIAPGTFFVPAQEFGYLSSKVGNRTFQARIRFAF